MDAEVKAIEKKMQSELHRSKVVVRCPSVRVEGDQGTRMGTNIVINQQRKQQHQIRPQAQNVMYVHPFLPVHFGKFSGGNLNAHTGSKYSNYQGYFVPVPVAPQQLNANSHRNHSLDAGPKVSIASAGTKSVHTKQQKSTIQSGKLAEKTHVFDNKRERKINELYLNSKGADVNFVFKDTDTDHSEKIPAHKIILCMDSPVFDQMFFGSMKEQGDVEIVDATAAAFKEFLQFFYLNEVTLSSANIILVTNLCKKYEMNECLKPCETALQNSLTMEEMCFGYSIAQLFELENLRRFCKENIKANPEKIKKSESFLECDDKSLSIIMALVSSDWDILARVIAYMEWSKAQCKRNNLDPNPKNLRNQLKDVFNEVPFDELNTQQLSQHVASYKGFFAADELEKLLIEKTLPKQPNPFDF